MTPSTAHRDDGEGGERRKRQNGGFARRKCKPAYLPDQKPQNILLQLSSCNLNFGRICWHFLDKYGDGDALQPGEMGSFVYVDVVLHRGVEVNLVVFMGQSVTSCGKCYKRF